MDSNSQKSNSESDQEKPKPIRKCVDLQRLKLDKLMKNYDKPVIIPERPKEKNISHAPEFIRNVMGSSAGAGSGEFHVYRHLRRKEYARQKYIQLKSEKERLDEAYKKKLEDNARQAEERTAKKRAKRLKKKERMKKRKTMLKVQNKSNEEKSEDDTGDESDNETKGGDEETQEEEKANEKTDDTN